MPPSAPDDLISFGYEAFWTHSYNAFPLFWAVYPRLTQSINSIVYAEYRDVSSLQKTVINLGILGAIGLVEISILVGNGLGQGALKIARSMLEISINAEFLRLFPEHLDDYLDWYLVERFKLLQYVRTNSPHLLKDYPAEVQQEIDSDYERVRPRFEITSANSKVPRLRMGWCAMALDARASKTEFQEIYKLIYPMGNKLLHGTIGGMSMHARTDEEIRIAPPPSLEYCKSALVGAHMCAIRLVTTVSKVMVRESSPTVAELEQDYAHAWPREQKTL